MSRIILYDPITDTYSYTPDSIFNVIDINKLKEIKKSFDLNKKQNSKDYKSIEKTLYLKS